VRGAVLDGPVLERAGDDVGDRGIERLAVRDRAAERAEDVFRQPRALRLFVEGERPEFVGRLAARRGAADAEVGDGADGVGGGGCETHEDDYGRLWPRAQGEFRENRHDILNDVSQIRPQDYYAPILGELELLVLIALVRLGNGAYGASILREIRDRT